MPLQATSGAASYDSFGGGKAAVPNYIEDVFSTYLYTGNGSTQTITNGIDLSTKGGLVWIKQRNQATSHRLFDTARGVQNSLVSNSTAATASFSGYLTAFNTNGFTVGSANDVNESGFPLTSWSWAKAPKFFDVVTFTTASDGSATVSHNLGSTPGCVITKCTGTTSAWSTWHRSLSGTNYEVRLNSTAAETNIGTWINPSSTQVQFISGTLIGSQTYVAYLYAHNAGGFGLTGTDNVISCGSFTTDGSGNASVTLGYEPQFVLNKSTGTQNWMMHDTMRSASYTNDAILYPNLSNAENNLGFGFMVPNATGFSFINSSLSASTTYIYIAIRRGPMKVPTSGTSVFSPISSSAAFGTNQTTGFPVDMQIKAARAFTLLKGVADRLRGVGTTPSSDIGVRVSTNLTNAETASASGGNSSNWTNTGFANPSDTAGISAIYWNFRRSPNFFDVVCWTGDDTTSYKNHNLTVIPELIIQKKRNYSEAWYTWQPSSTDVGQLNSAAAFFSNGASPATSTQFTPITSSSGSDYVAYLFATCAGVSKVGSYTGTGATQTINCGFTGGARFVLVKRTDSTGDWYVWDTARGIVSGNDPYLLLNSTAAEVTITDYIDPYSAGFELSTTAAATVNVLNGTYIYLAIA